MDASNTPKNPRFETVLKALERGERDCRLLDGRDFDEQYWRNAKRQLTTLRRELLLTQGERDALREVINGF